MSEGELTRAEVIRDLDEGRLTHDAAELLLGLRRRQVFRLLRKYRSKGARGLIPKKRGAPAHRRPIRAQALELVRNHYAALGPAQAAKQLFERHRIKVSKETMRKWMVEDGLPFSRRRSQRG